MRSALMCMCMRALLFQALPVPCALHLFYRTKRPVVRGTVGAPAAACSRCDLCSEGFHGA
jgi:hypothetical protein